MKQWEKKLINELSAEKLFAEGYADGVRDAYLKVLSSWDRKLTMQGVLAQLNDEEVNLHSKQKKKAEAENHIEYHRNRGYDAGLRYVVGSLQHALAARKQE